MSEKDSLPMSAEALRTVNLLLQLSSQITDERIQRILLEAGHRVADLVLASDARAA